MMLPKILLKQIILLFLLTTGLHAANSNTPLHDAAKKGDIQALRAMLPLLVEKCPQNDLGETPYDLGQLSSCFTASRKIVISYLDASKKQPCLDPKNLQSQEHFLNPKIASELLAYISDTDDQVVGINTKNANDNHQYYMKELDYHVTYDDTGYFYDGIHTTYIGQTENGVHALLTRDQGGGSGVFTSILLYYFDESKGQRIAKKLTELFIGDRWHGKLRVEKNAILIGKDRSFYENTSKDHWIEVMDWSKPVQILLKPSTYRVYLDQSPFVNPAIVEDFVSWPQDNVDTIVQVDLQGGYDTNRYFLDVHHPSDPTYYAVEEIGYCQSNFRYTCVGKTNNGIYVVLTRKQMFDQKPYYSLIYLTFEDDIGYLRNENRLEPYLRNVLKKVGQMHLGLDWAGEAMVIGNMLYVFDPKRLVPLQLVPIG